jgi:hypothetical protein
MRWQRAGIATCQIDPGLSLSKRRSRGGMRREIRSSALPLLAVKATRSFLSSASTDSAQVVGRRFAGLSIGNDFELNLLAFVEAMHPGAFDRADMHEDVLPAIVRLNEAEAFLTVEPFHDALRQ